MAFTLKSSAFSNQASIPVVYTCDGKDVSPTLVWEGAPPATQSFALIMDDPDAPMGTWDHWLLYNIPADTHDLPEHIQKLPVGTLVGKNSWGRNDYGGPCPPDREHRYFFVLYALDTILNLPVGADKKTLQEAMQDHILAKAELIGKYDRKKR